MQIVAAELKLNDSITLNQANGFDEVTFDVVQEFGSGAFGTVYKARSNFQFFAVKKALVRLNDKDSEINIIKKINGHSYIVRTINYYFAKSEVPGFCTLNLVMEFYPGNLYKFISGYLSAGKKVPPFDFKLIAYQLLRGLSWLHVNQLIYCDFKPQNILIKKDTFECVLCDFGTCKQFVRDKPRCAYVCSRYYRAPELMYGNKFYERPIDMWSFGCVLAEMLIGRPLFQGNSPIEQLVEIIKILGTPSVSDIWDMNPNLQKVAGPPIIPDGLQRIVGNQTDSFDKESGEHTFQLKDPLLADLLNNILIFSPRKRFTAFQALAHEYFDEIRQHKFLDSQGVETEFGVNLFTFQQSEIQELREQLGQAGVCKLTRTILPEQTRSRSNSQRQRPEVPLDDDEFEQMWFDGQGFYSLYDLY